MKKYIYILTAFIIFLNFEVKSQGFPEGTGAIHKDSAIIVSWATSIDVSRGYINISDTSQTFTMGEITSNRAWFGEPENSLGIADGNLVSFGDAGYAVVGFDEPIANGPGPDFAVFSNAMFSPPNQSELSFVEPAFVEVSSNGIDFVRFPAVSNMQYESQISSFDAVEWSKYINFAGIFPVFYGVGFDLEELDSELIDINHIAHVKIIDAVGCINPDYAAYDSQGNIVNSAWPTPFHTGGFDLDAVAVINTSENNSVITNNTVKPSFFPNPAKNTIFLTNSEKFSLSILNINGEIVKTLGKNTYKINIGNLSAGIYFLRFYNENYVYTKRIVVID